MPPNGRGGRTSQERCNIAAILTRVRARFDVGERYMVSIRVLRFTDRDGWGSLEAGTVWRQGCGHQVRHRVIDELRRAPYREQFFRPSLV